MMINKPRQSAEQAEAPRVVVGVDGSPASIRALQYAAEEAAWRGATLVIVNACQRPEGAASMRTPLF